jgi:NADH-quinone oxidoreductase subunit G
MEFLLINHPLDCPICDQGGECDLQDQSVAYGRGSSRYPENKRAVTEKYMGPIVKTVMTRCIQCTRCIRFAEEVAGIEEIGAVGRGENMQITSYLERAVTSELSGNVVDLCPVGALTSKPYAFEARPWELSKTPSIDVMDAVGTNIRLDARGRQVLRALPLINEDVNEEWASDKTRHAVDGLMHGRLDKPYVRNAKGKLESATWEAAFEAIAEVGKGAAQRVAVVAGDLLDCETLFAAKSLANSMGCIGLEGRQTGLSYDTSSLSAVNFNTSIVALETADIILLVGSDLRREAPLVNTRLQKAVRKHGAKVFAIGPQTDLSYNVTWLGDDLSALAKAPKVLVDALKTAQRPAIIVGGGALRYAGVHGAALAFAKKYKLIRTLEDGTNWNGFNVLHFAAARMGGLMLGYAYSGGIKALAKKKPKLAFFLGADEVDYSLFTDSFKVYVGHHGDAGAHAADVILPGAAYTEKSGTFVNLEGRVQRGERAVFPPGDAREDWAIFRALSAVLGKPLPFDTLAELRVEMTKDVPALGQLGLAEYGWVSPNLPADVQGKIVDYPIKDFYLTNAICRASETMQRCSAELVHGEQFLEAAE